MDVRAQASGLSIHGGAANRVILLSTYYKDVTLGRNPGTPGYSYEFVARLFVPLLEQWGKVVEVRHPERDLDALAEQARRQGKEPIHVCFRAFQDAVLCNQAPNVVVPAWEFPDVPHYTFDGNPRNNWVATANRCDQVIVGGPYTQEIFRQAGMKVPIHIVPVPTPDAYFEVPAWAPHDYTVLNYQGYVLPGLAAPEEDAETAPIGMSPKASLVKRIAAAPARWGRGFYKNWVRPCMPRRLEYALAAGYLAAELAWVHGAESCQLTQPLEFSGIIYTSIFSPVDGRKNWQDLISGFLFALGDCPDATLVLKLISSNLVDSNRVLDYYHTCGIPHQCKVVMIKDYLSDPDMVRLTQASAYYVQATRAEGNCLPLMNFLAAGRPAISPVHTAISDYFDDALGFVPASHPEPCSWPQDNSHHTRSTWQRLVWPSYVDQLRRSYHLAKRNPAAYQAMAAKGQARMRGWARIDAVQRRLDAALNQLCVPQQEQTPRLRLAA